MNWKAVLFDLDGTLLDTLPDLAHSVNEVLSRLGHPIHPVDAYRFFVGDGVDILMRRALPVGERASAEEIKDLVAAMEEDYSRRWVKHTCPYDGIPAMLDWFEKKRVPKAILSNKPDPCTQVMVRGLLSSWSFQTVRGATPGHPRKPDPAVALKIIHQMGIPPARAMFVGDSGIDMRTAVAAGMYPVGVSWGFRPRGELVRAGAQAIVDTPQEIIKLFSIGVG